MTAEQFKIALIWGMFCFCFGFGAGMHFKKPTAITINYNGEPAVAPTVDEYDLADGLKLSVPKKGGRHVTKR